MGPGIPGIGVTSVFYVLAGLLSPVRELAFALRGKSSPARWRLVTTQFLVSLGTVILVVGFYIAVEFAIDIGWLTDQRTSFRSLIPVWAYAFVALFAVLVALDVWARIKASVSPNEDPDVIARAHRLGVSEELAMVTCLAGNNPTHPRGKHLDKRERISVRHNSSTRIVDQEPAAVLRSTPGRYQVAATVAIE